MKTDGSGRRAVGRQQPVISALEDLIAAKEKELLVPQVLLDEFDRSKERVAADAARSLQSHFSLVRDAVNRFAEESTKAAALKTLAEVDHAAIIKGEAVKGSIDRIEKLFASVAPLPITEAIKARVTDRAIMSRAPYHRSKNSVGDAIIIEVYADHVAANRQADTRFAFVTHNVRDFSEASGDQRRPHADLLPLFDGTVSAYSISLLEVINGIDEDLLTNYDFEFNGFFQPRRLSEILEAENLLFRQVWYNRHWNLRTEIERGEHHVEPSEKEREGRPRRP